MGLSYHITPSPTYGYVTLIPVASRIELSVVPAEPGEVQWPKLTEIVQIWIVNPYSQFQRPLAKFIVKSQNHDQRRVARQHYFLIDTKTVYRSNCSLFALELKVKRNP